MTASEWVPFGLTAEERRDYAVLRDGLPGPMYENVLAWVSERLSMGSTGDWSERERLLDVQTVCRVDLGVGASGKSHVEGAKVRQALRNHDVALLLRVADYLASRLYDKSPHIRELDRVLTQGQSRWRVGERHRKPGLVERIPSGVQTAVEGVIGASDAAGEVLGRAWSDVHALEPRDSAAYSYAVRAVEIATIPVVTPGKTNATLGKVIGQMKADGDWRLPFREHPEAQSAEVLIAMLRTLWVGHRDRHGSPDYSDVTHDEARAAVTLASTLVDWFTSGAVQRRPL